MIKDTFLELLIEKPIENVTVKELCLKADINRGTFYRYYTDIYDLFHQLEKEIISEERANRNYISFNDHEARKHWFNNKLLFIYNNINFYKVFFSAKLKSEYLENLIQNSRETIVNHFIETNIPFDKVHFNYAFEYTRCGVVGIIKKWVVNDCPEPPEVIADIIYKMLEKHSIVELQ